jgi:hypothetical protein
MYKLPFIPQPNHPRQNHDSNSTNTQTAKMKLATALLSLAALAIAAPSANPSAEGAKLEAKDTIPTTEQFVHPHLFTHPSTRTSNNAFTSSIKERGTHWEATLQVWTGSSVCSPEPTYTWFPVSYVENTQPNSQACYNHWENGVRQNIKSTMLTGPWGANCYLLAYAHQECGVGSYGANGVRQAGPYSCITLPNNIPILGVVVRCS